MKFPIGTKVSIFEKDGFETEDGIIAMYDGDWIYVRCKEKTLRLKNPRINISFTTRGNSLKQYEV